MTTNAELGSFLAREAPNGAKPIPVDAVWRGAAEAS
jgi:hypothetical protein